MDLGGLTAMHVHDLIDIYNFVERPSTRADNVQQAVNYLKWYTFCEHQITQVINSSRRAPYCAVTDLQLSIAPLCQR
jgi:hypothetical protein